MILLLNKKQGQTPLECIQEYKVQFPEFARMLMTYAGRLDPMAEGLLLILSGDDINNKDNFLGLEKTYEVEFILRFNTDTYDLLGLPDKLDSSDDINEKVENELHKFFGDHLLPTPPYSSRPVNGKPLFMWARENKLSEITIPKHTVSVKSIQYKGFRNINGAKLLEETVNKISRVSGDFRQTETIERWQKIIEPEANYTIYRATLTVSSGTYIRAVIHELGNRLGTGAVVFSLKRTSVGEYALPN
jgi:tRNA pseudouridine55 synthase